MTFGIVIRSLLKLGGDMRGLCNTQFQIMVTGFRYKKNIIKLKNSLERTNKILTKNYS